MAHLINCARFQQGRDALVMRVFACQTEGGRAVMGVMVHVGTLGAQATRTFRDSLLAQHSRTRRHWSRERTPVTEVHEAGLCR